MVTPEYPEGTPDYMKPALDAGTSALLKAVMKVRPRVAGAGRPPFATAGSLGNMDMLTCWTLDGKPATHGQLLEAAGEPRGSRSTS